MDQCPSRAGADGDLVLGVTSGGWHVKQQCLARQCLAPRSRCRRQPAPHAGAAHVVQQAMHTTDLTFDLTAPHQPNRRRISPEASARHRGLTHSARPRQPHSPARLSSLGPPTRALPPRRPHASTATKQAGGRHPAASYRMLCMPEEGR